jgi:hypothetical protein
MSLGVVLMPHIEEASLWNVALDMVDAATNNREFARKLVGSKASSHASIKEHKGTPKGDSDVNEEGARFYFWMARWGADGCQQCCSYLLKALALSCASSPLEAVEELLFECLVHLQAGQHYASAILLLKALKSHSLPRQRVAAMWLQVITQLPKEGTLVAKILIDEFPLLEEYGVLPSLSTLALEQVTLLLHKQKPDEYLSAFKIAAFYGFFAPAYWAGAGESADRLAALLQGLTAVLKVPQLYKMHGDEITAALAVLLAEAKGYPTSLSLALLQWQVVEQLLAKEEYRCLEMALDYFDLNLAGIAPHDYGLQLARLLTKVMHFDQQGAALPPVKGKCLSLVDAFRAGNLQHCEQLLFAEFYISFGSYEHTSVGFQFLLDYLAVITLDPTRAPKRLQRRQLVDLLAAALIKMENYAELDGIAAFLASPVAKSILTAKENGQLRLSMLQQICWLAEEAKGADVFTVVLERCLLHADHLDGTSEACIAVVSSIAKLMCQLFTTAKRFSSYGQLFASFCLKMIYGENKTDSKLWDAITLIVSRNLQEITAQDVSNWAVGEAFIQQMSQMLDYWQVAVHFEEGTTKRSSAKKGSHRLLETFLTPLITELIAVGVEEEHIQGSMLALIHFKMQLLISLAPVVVTSEELYTLIGMLNLRYVATLESFCMQNYLCMDLFERCQMAFTDEVSNERFFQMKLQMLSYSRWRNRKIPCSEVQETFLFEIAVLSGNQCVPHTLRACNLLRKYQDDLFIDVPELIRDCYVGIFENMRKIAFHAIQESCREAYYLYILGSKEAKRDKLGKAIFHTQDFTVNGDFDAESALIFCVGHSCFGSFLADDGLLSDPKRENIQLLQEQFDTVCYEFFKVMVSSLEDAIEHLGHVTRRNDLLGLSSSPQLLSRGGQLRSACFEFSINFIQAFRALPYVKANPTVLYMLLKLMMPLALTQSVLKKSLFNSMLIEIANSSCNTEEQVARFGKLCRKWHALLSVSQVIEG